MSSLNTAIESVRFDMMFGSLELEQPIIQLQQTITSDKNTKAKKCVPPKKTAIESLRFKVILQQAITSDKNTQAKECLPPCTANANLKFNMIFGSLSLESLIMN